MSAPHGDNPLFERYFPDLCIKNYIEKRRKKVVKDGSEFLKWLRLCWKDRADEIDDCCYSFAMHLNILR